jgi:hypothetical protein
MTGGYSAPPTVHSSLDRITEAETSIVTSERDMLRRNHGTRPGSGVGVRRGKAGLSSGCKSQERPARP